MPIRFQHHLRSNLVGYLALAVALSGTAYAATAPPKNSVTSKSIKKGAVKGPKIASNAVSGPKVMDGSLTRADLDVAGLGTVPNSAHADTADTAANATHAASADNATNAANAGNAEQLGGSAASSFLKGTDVFGGGDLTGSYAEPGLADNSVGGAEVANSSLAGADVQANSLTGTQINESTLNGVDADSFGGEEPSDYVHGHTPYVGGVDAVLTSVHSDDDAANTSVVDGTRYDLRTTGTAHQFKICSEVSNVTQHFVIVANGVRTTQSLAGFACGAAFSTGGSGTTVPGDFTVFGSSMILFGGPWTQISDGASTERYTVSGIGLGSTVP